LLALASVTDSLVTLATHVINDLGLAGVALLCMTTGIIGLPGTEPTMLFAGFNVSDGSLSMAGIIVAGLVGDMLGASIAFAIGYFGRAELLERQGSKIHMSQRRLNIAHAWFERWGAPAVFFSRLIPVARAAVPYAAGVAQMPFWRFFTLALLGSIPWIVGLAVLGNAVGNNWESWRHHLEYVDYVGLALVVGVIVWLILRRRSSGGAATDAAS
jgi:membrane protein DedA with SNARE-associated domain